MERATTCFPAALITRMRLLSAAGVEERGAGRAERSTARRTMTRKAAQDSPLPRIITVLPAARRNPASIETITAKAGTTPTAPKGGSALTLDAAASVIL